MKTNIDDFDSHLNSLQKGFLHVLELNQNAEHCVRLEFQQQLESKDKIITDLQQRCRCKICGTRYTINSKSHEYPEEVRELAIKMYYSGVSGRGVGKALGMSKSNVYNWIKKTEKLGKD